MVCSFTFCFGQNDSLYRYYKARASGYFTNLDSAFRYPEKVYYLDISKIYLPKITDDFCKFTHLEILQVYSCNIEIVTDKIGELQNLERIDLSFNRLKTLPSTIINLQKLKLLNLGHNQIEKVQEEVYKLKNLEALILPENLLSSSEKKNIVKKLKDKDVSIVFKEQKRTRRERHGKKRRN